MSRVVVTGASGFLGRALVRQLSGEGVEVHAVIHRRSVPDAVNHRSDIDLQALASAVQPDAVYHLAGVSTTSIAHHELSESLDANVSLGCRVLHAFTSMCPVLIVGTFWQHVNGSEYRPNSLYAAMKQAQLDIARYFAAQDAAIVNVELCDTYGPGDERGKLLGALLDAAVNGSRLELSPGQQLIDLVHVEDAARAMRLAVAHAGPGLASWSVSSGSPLTVQELVERCCHVWQRPIDARFGTRPYRPIEMFHPWHVHPPVPDFIPAHDLAQGLEALMADRS